MKTYHAISLLEAEAQVRPDAHVVVDVGIRGEFTDAVAGAPGFRCVAQRMGDALAAMPRQYVNPFQVQHRARLRAVDIILAHRDLGEAKGLAVFIAGDESEIRCPGSGVA